MSNGAISHSLPDSYRSQVTHTQAYPKEPYFTTLGVPLVWLAKQLTVVCSPLPKMNRTKQRFIGWGPTSFGKPLYPPLRSGRAAGVARAGATELAHATEPQAGVAGRVW